MLLEVKTQRHLASIGDTQMLTPRWPLSFDMDAEMRGYNQWPDDVVQALHSVIQLIK